MIVDCHHHIIQHWIGACGHPTRDLHAKYLQWSLARTVAKTFRQRDGAPADTRALYRQGAASWQDLNDVDFRVGKFGQLEFTVEGEDYYIQYMPVGMQEMQAPPELMLAQMTYAGVDRCILQAGGAYGRMSDFNAFAARQYADKVTGLMHVDEAMAGSPEMLDEIDRAHRELGLRGIYYNLDSFARHGFRWGLDDKRLEPFWAKLDAQRIVLCIELTSAPSYDRAGYIGHLTALGRQLGRHPNIPCHLAMGPPVQHFANNGKWDFPEEVAKVYRRDNFWIEVMFPITWGGVWDYPYREAHPLIRDLRDQVGVERLMWGSDMPNVERFCTYRQSLDYVRKYCDFLSPREMDLVLGGNAARLYHLS
ncbi:MAG: amidohydrolase family protein [Pseudomonadota bacterium]